MENKKKELIKFKTWLCGRYKIEIPVSYISEFIEEVEEEDKHCLKHYATGYIAGEYSNGLFDSIEQALREYADEGEFIFEIGEDPSKTKAIYKFGKDHWYKLIDKKNEK